MYIDKLITHNILVLGQNFLLVNIRDFFSLDLVLGGHIQSFFIYISRIVKGKVNQLSVLNL